MATTKHFLQRGIDLHTKGDLTGARSQYRSVLEKDPRNVDALHLCGLVEFQTGHLDDAEFLIRAAIAIKPNLAPFHSNLGTVMLERGYLDEAQACYLTATKLAPDFSDAWNNLGNLASRRNDHDLAVDCFSTLVRISGGRDGQALGYLSLSLAVLARWSEVQQAKAQILAQSQPWLRPVPPFSVLMHDFTPAQQRSIAETAAGAYHAEAVAALGGQPPVRTVLTAPRPEKLRIGFVGDDFQNHAVAYLFIGLLEAYDRARFETVVFSYGPPDTSTIRARIEAACDRFIDIRTLDWRQSAEVIAQQDIHILIDLKGHTGTPRAQIFALRPALVQVAWLGFPGTFGGPDFDYILADPFVIPEGRDSDYSETVVRLPGCYQPNDPKRAFTPARPPRAEVGLPDAAFVFGALNNSYKITQPVFGVWMALLHSCPASVLWLLDHHPAATAALRAHTKAAGIDPQRLIFAPRVDQDRHLLRLAAADLAIDTFPYGGHTTTSDFLWAGVPVVTLTGQTFASRVAGSLLSNVGLTELITTDLADYRAKIQALFDNPDHLARLRGHLEQGRHDHRLFDAPRFARDFETALDGLWVQRV